MDCNLDFFCLLGGPKWCDEMSVKKSARDIFMKDDGGGPSNIILAGQSFFLCISELLPHQSKTTMVIIS